jgi:WD40 repeat protein
VVVFFWFCYSTQLSRSGQFLLSCGRDRTARLWDLHLGRPVATFNHAGAAVQRLPAWLAHDEESVVAASAQGNAVIVWHTRTGTVKQSLPLQVGV